MTTEDWQGINSKSEKTIINNPVINIGESKQKQALNPPNNIPYRGVRNFVGRGQELETLHQELQKTNVAVSAVAGMGGVGKTELAIRYARQHEANYPGGICWLNGRDSNLAAQIVLFAQNKMSLEVPQKRGESPLNLNQQVEWCWQNWQPVDGIVLVVLDDVTDLRSCRGVLPTASRFRVLMTTRLRGLDTNFVPLPLDVLSPDAALELLTALVGERRVMTSPPTPLLGGEGSKTLSPHFPRREGGLAGALVRRLGLSDAHQLCEWLGYLPLGLELVGRYLIQDPDLSLAEMLQRLKATPGLQDEAIDPDEEQLQERFSTAQRGVRAAFELSWQELEPLTQRVAEYLSLYAPTVFVWEWIASATELFNCSKSEINTAKKQLYKRHLIERVEEREGGYKIHPLIREFLQAKLEASEQKDEFRQAFAETFVEVAKKIPQSPTVEFIESVKEAIPHLAEVAQTLMLAQKLEDVVLKEKDLTWSFNGLGKFYKGQGLYALAEPWFQQCLELSQHLLGENHPHVATSLNNLAELYYSQGRYEQAEPLFCQALELRQHLLGENHPSVAFSLNNLALLYYSQGRYEQAEPLFCQALELSKHLLGENHPSVAFSLNNLALLYYSQGRYEQAEPLFCQALELSKHLLGENHPYVATSLNNLALLYYSQGRYEQAEPLYLQALELSERVLGVNHPNSITIRENLELLR
jgi:tetratricopeptide (TPR) repeat protein